MAGKSYVWPVPADHAECVLCCSSISVPCRVPMYMVKMFNLPVDLCGIAFPDHIYSKEALDINPIHSFPWLMVYVPGEEKPLSINGSEAIVMFLIEKYRDLIPDSFYPKDPARAAVMMQKSHHISHTCYRSTMYQFVYPAFGLMSECQYDLCKRDFGLDIVEQWAKAKDTDFFEGSEPTVADLYWHSVWMGNNWVQDDAKFSKLPWRHKDVIDKYPASKRIIEAVAKLDAVKEVCDLAFADNIPSINIVNATGFFGMLGQELPGNARKFVLEPGVHPNFVGHSEKKAAIDVPLTVD